MELTGELRVDTTMSSVASVVVKLRKFQWTGHVERMDDKRIPKRIFKGILKGRSPVGKPRKWWEHLVDEASKNYWIFPTSARDRRIKMALGSLCRTFSFHLFPNSF